MNILAIETSCDETAAAVVENGTIIHSNVIASSSTMHKKYGGILPELAAREQLSYILPVITEALSVFDPSATTMNHELLTMNHIDAIAITVGPGLIGSLLVGVETAKTIAFVTGKPIIPVNHVLAHMYANFVNSSSSIVHSKEQNYEQLTMNHELIKFPVISLVVSGGHTELYLMKSHKELLWLGGTLDDAAGEAFDKTARLLGFENLGGPAIQEAAKKYTQRHPERSEGSLSLVLSSPNPMSEDLAFARDSSSRQIRTQNDILLKFPRPMMHDETLNFSFSGLKTAVLREFNKRKAIEPFDKSQGKQLSNATLQQISEQATQQFAYEIQEAITDVLVAKTLHAAEKFEAKSILLSGGVAANIRLREKLIFKLKTYDLRLTTAIPEVSLCTDNAAYIASYAYFRGEPIDWHDITAIPDLNVEVIG